MLILSGERIGNVRGLLLDGNPFFFIPLINMIEFNHSILADWILTGYKFVLVINNGSQIKLKPIFEDIPLELAKQLKCFTLPIGCDEMIMFADGDDLQNFKILVADDN